MTYCVKCGAQVADGVNFCPQCGAVVPEDCEEKESFCEDQTQENPYTYDSGTQGQQYTYDQNYTYEYNPEYFPEEEVKKNKAMGVVSYLGMLVLIPLLAGDKNSPYLKQHVNQGLIMFVIDAVLEVVERIVDDVILIGGILSWASDIVGFAIFILMIMGIISACKGTRKPLPIVGNIKIFK